MKSLPWVLVDLSYMAHRARHSLHGLNHEDYPTGVLFGFFHQLRTACQDYRIRSNRIVVFADSRKSIRKKTLPSYKEKRRTQRTEEEIIQVRAMRDQMNLLQKKHLPAIGIGVHHQVGLEADDLMAWAARDLAKRGERVILLTSDSDLYQCLSSRVSLFDPGRDRLITRREFELLYGVTPSQWALVKSIAGDSSDEIKGVGGVGITTALQFVRGELEPRLKRYQTIISPEGKEVTERNLSLIRLPHRKTKPLQLKSPDFSIDAFFAFCERYELASFLRERNTWKVFFRGHKVRKRRSHVER